MKVSTPVQISLVILYGSVDLWSLSPCGTCVKPESPLPLPSHNVLRVTLDLIISSTTDRNLLICDNFPPVLILTSFFLWGLQKGGLSSRVRLQKTTGLAWSRSTVLTGICLKYLHPRSSWGPGFFSSLSRHHSWLVVSRHTPKSLGSLCRRSIYQYLRIFTWWWISTRWDCKVKGLLLNPRFLLFTDAHTYPCEQTHPVL